MENTSVIDATEKFKARRVAQRDSLHFLGGVIELPPEKEQELCETYKAEIASTLQKLQGENGLVFHLAVYALYEVVKDIAYSRVSGLEAARNAAEHTLGFLEDAHLEVQNLYDELRWADLISKTRG